MVKNVILDRGHGSIDKNGNYSTSPNKMYEFPDGTVAYEGLINSGITSHIGSCLKQHSDINVVYTVHPDDPRDLTLPYRIRVANSFDPKSSIFVSIHCNASLNHNAGGFEIFTSIGETESDKLARYTHDMAKLAVGRAGMRDRGLKEADFYVLNKTKCAAILIECGFFDFKYDFVNLKDPLFQGDLGSMIYTGILKYINGKNKQQE